MLISLLWIGCSTEQMQNVTGSMPVNAYSVVQGLITSGSIISRSTEASLSRIVFEDGTLVNLNPSDTFSSSEEYSYSQQENNIILDHDSEDSLNQQLTNSNIDLDARTEFRWLISWTPIKYKFSYRFRYCFTDRHL